MLETLIISLTLIIILLPIVLWIAKEVIGIQYIRNDQAGVIEKLWGPPIKEGKIIALSGEAGFQSDLKRGGLHSWRTRPPSPPPEKP